MLSKISSSRSSVSTENLVGARVVEVFRMV
jgi:hypothetical protein